MEYNLFGKDFDTNNIWGKIALKQELMYNPKLTSNKALIDAKTYLHLQRDINAEERAARETDPSRKKLMERMISRGLTNFDHYFGPENK